MCCLWADASDGLMSIDGRNLVTLPWEGVDGVTEPGRVRIWELEVSPLGPPRT